MQKNEAQEKIIQNTDGQMIVIACPGSGKTTTLLRRINYMVKERKIPGESVLMITFTKAAAKEMKERYAKMFGSYDDVTFCTIHALCLAVLKKFAGYSAENLVKNQTEYIFPMISHNSEIRDKGKFVRDALMDISVVKNNQINVSKYKPNCCDDAKLFQKIYTNYVKKMKEDGVIDFDDILILTYDLMKKERDILDWIRDKYAYIHVDEYQDTNFLQRDIVYLMAGENGNLTVVGDDDQSIYSFRGARPEVMLSFKKDYSEAKAVYMTTNYRSDRDIIAHADSLIQNNKNRFSKQFIPFSTENGSVRCIGVKTKNEQLFQIAEEISELVHIDRVNPNNIAVLYRTNSQASEVAELLQSFNVNFYSNETIENRYSHWMYQDILSYLKMSRGEGTQQDFIRTASHPNRWLGKINIEKTGLDRSKMYKALYDPNQEDWKNEKTRRQIDEYLSVISVLKAYDLGNAALKLGTVGGYIKYLKEYAAFLNENENEYADIYKSYLNDIKRWNVQTVSDWEKKVNQYVRMFNENQKEKSGICLSTMHKSKGLEWDYVYIIDAVDGITPYKKGDEPVYTAEERRLFYVAMTRAKRNLCITFYRYRGKKPVSPSPFLYEAGLL